MTSTHARADSVTRYVPGLGTAGALINPAKLPAVFGGRDGKTGSFASAYGMSATVTAVASDCGIWVPEAICDGLARSARSLSMGHLNLSQPTGSCANAGVAANNAMAIRKGLFMPFICVRSVA